MAVLASSIKSCDLEDSPRVSVVAIHFQKPQPSSLPHSHPFKPSQNEYIKIYLMLDPFVALASVSKDLKKENIPVVEYGEVLNVRFGYPACIVTFKWGVPDSQLSSVSNILLAHDIPLGGISASNVKSYGEWETSGLMHKCGSVRIQILPLSSIFLSLHDCEEETSALSREQKTLIPKPRPYFISLVRILLTLPLGSRRLPISSDLGVFLNYCVYPRLPDGDDDESKSEEHFQQRVEQAISCVHQWDWATWRGEIPLNLQRECFVTAGCSIP